jgi:hypothetical protein
LRSPDSSRRGSTPLPSWASDRRNLYAVVKALEIVGQAAKNVSPGVRNLAPDVPWTQIAGMRDRLIHGYRDVDLRLVWITARERTAEAATRPSPPPIAVSRSPWRTTPARMPLRHAQDVTTKTWQTR